MRDLLSKCLSIIEERGRQYGDALPSFSRAALAASGMTGKNLSPRDIALVLHAVKMSRLAYDPDHEDSQVDGINYLLLAFSLPSNVTKDGR